MRVSEIIEWLYPAEMEAAQTYRSVAERFRELPEFAAFLTRLAEDEDGHLRLLDRARRLLVESAADCEVEIIIPLGTRDHVQSCFQELQALAAAGSFTETDALARIVEAEFSEWNNVFLYTLAQFREYAPAFQQIAAVMQHHEQYIEAYVAKLPADRKPPATLRLPPRVWDRHILVADDDPALRVGMELFLNHFGQVTAAVNGREALDRARQQFFDVIVSDVKMPVMTGPEFFQAMRTAAMPGHDRFVFVTGELPDEVQRQCGSDRVRILTKPFSLPELHTAVRSVLEHAG